MKKLLMWLKSYRHHFRDIAKRNPAWQVRLERTLEKVDFAPGEETRLYNRVLPNKDFTYGLFEQLADDFNGDMFPKDEQENIMVWTFKR